MKDDRVKEIAYGIPIVGRATVARWEVEVAIRLALAERDREVADFARHESRVGEIDGWVSVADLIEFLEAQP